ncbi:hypothetical protein HYE23_01020 [Mycoplasmopsis bovis]|nr:hypothetical protein [Mycoplasmopsis bovis]QQH23842.1 hypothetical protein HYE23_01020 [Mycoplasmopsis bovis]
MVLVIHLRILPHKLKVIKTEEKPKSTDIVSIKTDPTNSRQFIKSKTTPKLKVVLFTGC